jgi:hypothetical protein
MELINVRQKLRPIRYAFLIRPDDSAGLVRAVSLNTILWGRVFNVKLGFGIGVILHFAGASVEVREFLAMPTE